METNKYYTPSIEEFHVGFEYQGLVDYYKNEYKTFIVENAYDLIKRMETYISQDMDWVRVKYLDKEDIESLGFEQQSLPYQFKKDWYKLVKRHEENQYIIEDGRYQDQIFVGVIKNKSELKKLLTQLGIND